MEETIYWIDAAVDKPDEERDVAAYVSSPHDGNYVWMAVQWDGSRWMDAVMFDDLEWNGVKVLRWAYITGPKGRLA